MRKAFQAQKNGPHKGPKVPQVCKYIKLQGSWGTSGEGEQETDQEGRGSVRHAERFECNPRCKEWSLIQFMFLKECSRGTCVAQSVKCPTLGFSSGHDLTVCGFEPCNGLCPDSGACSGFSLSTPPPVSLSFSLSLSLSLKINNFLKNF